MTIQVELNDNTSSIKVKTSNKSGVKTTTSNTETIRTQVEKDNKVIPACVDSNDEVCIRSDCDTKEKVLDNKITKEREERIAADEQEAAERTSADNQEREERIAADEELERQIQEIIIGGVMVDETTITFNDNNELSVTPELLNTISKKQDEIEFIPIPVDELSGTLDPELLNYIVTNSVNRLVRGNKIYYLSIVNGNVKRYFSTAAEDYDAIDVNVITGEYTVTNTRIVAHMNNNTIHITQAEREFWNNKVTADIETISSGNHNLVLTKN